MKFKTYPIPKKGQDVLEWLKQFEVQNEINIVYDYDVDPDDWKGVSSYSLSIYKNGITVHEYLSYESVSIKIEIPFLSKNDAKIIFEELNLFNLARGCIDDFTLQFEHNNKNLFTQSFF